MDTGYVIFWLVIICLGLAYYSVGQKGDNVSLRLQLEAEAEIERFNRLSSREKRKAFADLTRDYDAACLQRRELEIAHDPKRKKWNEADYSELLGPGMGKAFVYDQSDLGKARWRCEVLRRALDKIESPLPQFESVDESQFVLFLEERINIRIGGKLRFIPYKEMTEIRIGPKEISIRCPEGPLQGNARLRSSGFGEDDWEDITNHFSGIKKRLP